MTQSLLNALCILHGNTSQNEVVLWTQLRTCTACIRARAGPQVLACCCTHAAEEQPTSKSETCVRLTSVVDLHATALATNLHAIIKHCRVAATWQAVWTCKGSITGDKPGQIRIKVFCQPQSPIKKELCVIITVQHPLVCVPQLFVSQKRRQSCP